MCIEDDPADIREKLNVTDDLIIAQAARDGFRAKFPKGCSYDEKAATKTLTKIRMGQMLDEFDMPKYFIISAVKYKALLRAAGQAHA
jgi:hypothetical protein